jgi:methionyl-tRNA formyltransferase
LRLVFLGTSEFAAAVLERLAASSHRPVLVLTRPDRPQGRGRRVAPPPVARCARALELPLAQPERVNDEATLETIAAGEPEAVAVCAFGALIKEPLLSRYEMLNVHPSLLPRWRGAAPIERSIMAGDAQTGVSIMRLTAGLDSGPVCLMQAVPIGPQDTYGSLAARLQELGGELLVRALDALAEGGSLQFTEQDEGGATYAEKIVAEDRLLDPKRPVAELERVVRALAPHIGARVVLPDGTLLGVQRARPLQEGAQAAGAPGANGGPAGGTEPTGAGGAGHAGGAGGARHAGAAGGAGHAGRVVVLDGRLVLPCADGNLELLEVKPPGGRAMQAQAFVRGHAIPRA